MKRRLLYSFIAVVVLVAMAVQCAGAMAKADEPEGEIIRIEKDINDYTVMIRQENKAEEMKEYVYAWTVPEIEALARIAMAEAEGEGLKGKALVIRVVINRVEAESFPDSIEEVIFEEGQFEPVDNGRYECVEPDAECWEAIEMVATGWDETCGATFFATESANAWHEEALEYAFTYGNHMFYRERTAYE